MRILLDTRIYLWWVKNDNKLSQSARNISEITACHH